MAKKRECYVSSMQEVPVEGQPGRSKWELVEDKEFRWVFHGWGIDYEEFEAGPASFTCAIVEAECGKVALVRADWIRFCPDEQPKFTLKELPKTVLKSNGLVCPVCGLPQFITPHGPACDNGHGGLDGEEPTHPLGIPCCNQMDRDHNGGCLSCGDPCL